jgi:hypothetical protein
MATSTEKRQKVGLFQRFFHPSMSIFPRFPTFPALSNFYSRTEFGIFFGEKKKKENAEFERRSNSLHLRNITEYAVLFSAGRPSSARCRNMPHSSAMCRTAVLRGAGDLHSSGAASSAAHGASLAIACGGPSF